MTRQPRLPALARWLLRLSSVPREARDDVQDDLHELFKTRRRDRGMSHAHWRLYCDVASLWFRPRKVLRSTGRRSRLALLRDARDDLGFAARLFARQPGILLLTIVGLSLGLGTATAAFSILNVAAIRREGFVDPDRAPGVLKTTDRSISTVWTYGEFLRLREAATRMQVEAIFTKPARVSTTATDADAPHAVLAFVSGGFFAATGGRVIIGRPLARADEQHAGPPPVVVSFVFWASRLNRDPAVVGRTIWIGRSAATVVGVAARGFSLPRSPALWTPLTAYPAVHASLTVTRAPDTVEIFGRLSPGVTLAEAEAQLSGVAGALPAAANADGSPPRVRLDPQAGLGREASSDALAITVFVSVVILLVLLLACANVASVLISTAITREREMGIRAALGASQARIVRQLVTESLALGAIGAAFGLVLAYWTLPVIVRMIAAPSGADFAPDVNVYLFLAAATVVTGVTAGLAPARHTRGADLLTPLKGGEYARADQVAPRRLRSMLVMTQAAVSVVLIVLAALFVRATFRTAAIDAGFDTAGLYSVSRDSSEEDAARTRSFWARARAELQAVPGVESVTLTELAPFGGESKAAITREAPARTIHFNRTSAEYFETIGLRLLAGRTFTRDEIATNAPVALVSHSLARAYFGDDAPIGQPLPREIPVSTTRPVIIGVVADGITTRLYERNTLAFYEPLDPANERFARLLLRVSPGSTDAIDRASARLRAIDPQAELRIMSVHDRFQRAAGQPRMLATLTGVVGIIAIVLCVIGLYGLTASVVGQRAREMAVRVAMGAAPRDLLRLLMWEGLRPVVVGLAAGAGAAFLAGRVIAAAMFFGVSPQDPIALAGAAAMLLGAATLAVLVPTRRAASVDAACVLKSS